jgi:hypothetical protein
MKKQDLMNKTTEHETCVGIHELIDYQILQYRKTVDEHRTDLSKAEGRCVAWQEAEMDFNSHDRAEVGNKTRREYCGLLCPHKESCLVALRFLGKAETTPFYRYG